MVFSIVVWCVALCTTLVGVKMVESSVSQLFLSFITYFAMYVIKYNDLSLTYAFSSLTKCDTGPV